MKLEPLTRFEQLRACKGEIPGEGVYTYGPAGERFFREIKERGRILGTRCSTCSLTYVPARLFCERCFAELGDWVDVGMRGTVHAVTTLYMGLDGAALEKPEPVAFVRIADGGLIARLIEIAPERASIGMEVEAVLKPPSERTGSPLDILGFRPAG